jgi:ribonuclease HI
MESHAGSWGFLIRSHDGESILARVGNESPVYNAIMAETVACVKALEAVEAHGISRVQIETGTSKLCEALVNKCLLFLMLV